MLHPSYTDLMEVANRGVEEGEEPVVRSRYSIVIATSKRARQLIDGAEPLVDGAAGKKPLSIAVDELYEGKVRVLSEEEAAELEEKEAAALDFSVEELEDDEEVSEEEELADTEETDAY